MTGRSGDEASGEGEGDSGVGLRGRAGGGEGGRCVTGLKKRKMFPLPPPLRGFLFEPVAGMATM